MITVGLDLSMTSTGMVVLRNGTEVKEWINPKTTPKDSREHRLNYIVSNVMMYIEAWEPDLVVVEDYAFSKPQGATIAGELGGVMKHYLYLTETPFVPVQPMKLKALAGSGKFDKDDMILAARDQFWPACPNISDIADAFWAARYAAVYHEELTA